MHTTGAPSQILAKRARKTKLVDPVYEAGTDTICAHNFQSNRQLFMQIPHLLRGALYYAVALLLSYLIVIGFGYHAKANNILNMLGLLLILLGWGFSALRVAVFALLLTTALYMPFGLVYGKPNFLMIASFLQTNRSESIEFVGQIPLLNFLLALGFAGAAWLFVFRLNHGKIEKRRLWVGLISLAISVGLFAKAMRSEETRKDILALDLPRNVAKSIQQYRKEEESFLNAQADGQWKVTSVDSKYRNYVIVVGESVRRDYMSVYGFDQKTTPFADQANGLFINGYVAPGPNTFTSVPRTLAEVKGDSVIYGRNLVTLARNADFRTYWLSNQGFVGEYDSPSSRLAASADVVHFTKLGSSDSGKIDDLALLEQLKAGLSDGTVGKRRMFVMHLMGSHPSFCERVKGEDQQFTASSASMRCYMGSIKHTDSVLAGAYAALRAAGEPFSLIYLGDHGLRHLDKGTAGATAVHAEDSKQSYAVPFFILSSDATAHIKLNKDMSGINFVKGAAQWMGIRAEGLPSYDFTTEAPDQQIRVFHSNGYQDYSSLKDDPV